METCFGTSLSTPVGTFQWTFTSTSQGISYGDFLWDLRKYLKGVLPVRSSFGTSQKWRLRNVWEVGMYDLLLWKIRGCTTVTF